jgi:hypothetical protein
VAEPMTDERQVKLATEAQLRFARELGLDVDETMPRWQVSKKITNEKKRRGRLAMKAHNPRKYDIVEHPRYGRCEITRIGDKTLKISLKPLDGGTGFSIDAMRLEDYPIIRG